MDIFVKLKKLLGIFGFQRTKDAAEQVTNTIRRMCCMLLITWMTLAILWFVLYEAQTFSDLANPMFVLCNGVNCVVVYSAFLQRSSQFLDLFDALQSEIEQRAFILVCLHLIFYKIS